MQNNNNKPFNNTTVPINLSKLHKDTIIEIGKSLGANNLTKRDTKKDLIEKVVYKQNNIKLHIIFANKYNDEIIFDKEIILTDQYIDELKTIDNFKNINLNLLKNSNNSLIFTKKKSEINNVLSKIIEVAYNEVLGSISKNIELGTTIIINDKIWFSYKDQE